MLNSSNPSFLNTWGQEKNGSNWQQLEAQVEKIALSCQKVEQFGQHLQAQLDGHEDKISNLSRVI